MIGAMVIFSLAVIAFSVSCIVKKRKKFYKFVIKFENNSKREEFLKVAKEVYAMNIDENAILKLFFEVMTEYDVYTNDRFLMGQAFAAKLKKYGEDKVNGEINK